MTYSLDFRKKVFELRKKEGWSIIETGKKFSLSPTTIMKWKKNLYPKACRNSPTFKIDMELLKADIEKYPDSYQYERAKRLGCSRSGIYYALKRLGVTYKKNFKTPKGQIRRTTCLPREDRKI